ncbi:sporulation membrane protein YtaF [Natronospora cellulosivora (SeqCode)]
MEINQIWPIFLLAIAISIDGFAVGITYGLRGIKVSLSALIIIGLISTASIMFTSFLGSSLARYMDADFAENIGGIILICLGIWLIYSAIKSLRKNSSDEKQEANLDDKVLLSLKIRSFGIIVNILKTPTEADFDKSGTINNFEALFLGFALAIDALGAGLGAGMTGFGAWYTPLIIGITTASFVGAGFITGKKAGNILPRYFRVFPGFIIILFGISNLL